MARRTRHSREVGGPVKDVVTVRLIKEIPQGSRVPHARVGDVVTVSFEQADLLIRQGQAELCADELVLGDAVDAGGQLADRSFRGNSRPRRASAVTPDGWDLVIHTGLNTLLVGPRPVTDRLIRSLRPRLSPPVLRIRPHLPFPPQADQANTIILEEVGHLDVSGQRSVLEYLERVGSRTRTISTSTVPLLHRVVVGAFDETLFYLLNEVYVRC